MDGSQTLLEMERRSTPPFLGRHSAGCNLALAWMDRYRYSVEMIRVVLRVDSALHRRVVAECCYCSCSWDGSPGG